MKPKLLLFTGIITVILFTQAIECTTGDGSMTVWENTNLISVQLRETTDVSELLVVLDNRPGVSYKEQFIQNIHILRFEDERSNTMLEIESEIEILRWLPVYHWDEYLQEESIMKITDYIIV